MDFKVLGKNIKKFRLLAGLTQSQLAEICECSNGHIGQVENAVTKPSLDMTVRIANALNTTVDQLLGFAYDHPEHIFLDELAARIGGYPREKRLQVCEDLNDYLDSLEKFSSK